MRRKIKLTVASFLKCVNSSLISLDKIIKYLVLPNTDFKIYEGSSKKHSAITNIICLGM